MKKRYPPWRGLFLGMAICGLIAVLVWHGIAAIRSGDGGNRGDSASPASDGTADASSSLGGSTTTASATPSPFVGIDNCGKCHPDELASYRQTAHAEAFALVEAAEEPPDQTFKHALSGRTYAVYRQGGTLRHRETQENGDQPGAISTDLPVKYRVGSGHHSRTYLAEVDGFLMESPITWYAARQEWDMSPGYDQSAHWGFERPADLGCLVCHVGQAERLQGAQHRLQFVEHAIGCENCHGPGREHVAFHQSESAGAADRNDPIIHPAKLDRQRSEALCANCHLRGAATVFRKGKDLSSFRPGMKLTDVRADFRYRRDDDRMNVTGHFDQLWLSRCYTESSSLTCTTCHDPHRSPDDPVTREDYRQTCLQCHSTANCGVPAIDSRRTTVADDCNHCHMPQVPTDIPHIAFTHHRIGIHAEPAEGPPHPADDLEPLLALEDWLPDEQRRAQALAYLEVSPSALARPVTSEAISLLTALSRADPNDSAIAAALARVFWEVRPAEAIPFAERALASGAQAKDRTNALFVAGSLYLQRGDAVRAQAALDELVTLRRNSEDWLLLGHCRWLTGDRTGSIAALEQALAINPFRPDLHSLLTELKTQAR
jgi:predicted CXXCH cytochrome family protein